MSEKTTDEQFMKAALRLSKRGRGFVNPNPMVGCVIVKDGEIIGRGYHKVCGGAHAEVNALNSCKASARGAQLYVTLEPCCHYGKTPPCTDIIIKHGISRVIIGTLDPNPLVSGKGAQLLRGRGIEVLSGVLERECIEQNEVFFHYITTKTPFVVMKYAMTADGKIAAKTGASKWITGGEARRHVHKKRAEYSAIMVGVGTVICDDPLLTCRIERGRNPTRIICDTRLKTPPGSQIVKTARDVPTIIATANTDRRAHEPYTGMGIEIITTAEKNGRIDLKALMTALGKRGIDSVLLEGGAALNWSALEENIVKRVLTYISPKLFGGLALSPVSGEGVKTPDDAFLLKNSKITRLGDDFLIDSKLGLRQSRDKEEVNL